MIDTISLTIEKSCYLMNDKIKLRSSVSKGFTKRIYNPVKEQLLQFGYLPRVTEFDAVRKGGYSTFIKVEFSIPKLLYGNNFDEVEESDFGEVCWKLKERLGNMGIYVVNVKDIINAQVSTIHYSKNIILTDYSTPYSVLKEFAKVNVSKLLDFNQSDFRNEGHAVKFHGNDFEVIFYDKLKDLQQAKISDKRSVEKDTKSQLHLFDNLEMKSPFEVLRLEIRLGNRKKIKGYTKIEDLTFVNLFRAVTSKRVLLETLDKIIASYPIIPNEQTNEEFYAELITKNPTLNYRKSLAFLGATVLTNEIGARKFREVTSKFGDKSWYRLNADIKKINITKTNPFKYLRDEVDVFETIRLVNFKDKI